MFNKYDHIKDKVETYIDLAGNLVVCNPSTDIHWDSYDSFTLEAALTDLLAYQLIHGLSWIKPEEIGEKPGSLLLGWDVQRGDMGEYIACYDVFRLPDHQFNSALKDLQTGKSLKLSRIV